MEVEEATEARSHTSDDEKTTATTSCFNEDEDVPMSPPRLNVSMMESGSMAPTSPFFRCRSSSPSSRRQQHQEVATPSLYEWREVEMVGDGPPAMSGLTAEIFERTMYVFGGFNDGEALDGLFGLDLDTNVWSRVQTVGPSPSPRTSHSMVINAARAKLYVCCGSGSNFGHSNLGDWYELDLRLRYWRRLEFSGDEITPRYGQTVVCYENRLYMFGGTFGREFSNDFFMLDVDRLRCCRLQSYGEVPSARYKHSAGIFNRNKMLVFGGAETQNYKLNDAHYINLDTMRWSTLDCIGDVPQGRFAHSMVVHDDKAYLFGGTDRLRCCSDLYMLDIATRVWSSIDCSGSVPRGRYFHGAIFDDARGEMLVWGGKGATQAQIRFNDLHAVALNNTLGHPDYKCSLACDLLALLESAELADLRIVSNVDAHEELVAHQLIVRARCPTLMQKLHYDTVGVTVKTDSGDVMSLDDDGEKQPHMARVCLDYGVKPLQILLRFLYSGELWIARELDLDVYLETMFVAAELQLPRLRCLCEKRVRDTISIEHADECLTRIQHRPLRHDSLERFLLQYTHVQLAHTHGPGVQLLFDDNNDVEKRSPTRFVSGELAVPPKRLHLDLLRLRHLTPEQAELLSMPFDLRVQFGHSRRRLYAHQLLLSARSAYFGSYSFQQGMMEAKSGVCTLPDKTEAVISQRAFECMLDYIYAGELVLDTIPLDCLDEFARSDACNYFGLSSKQLHLFAQRQGQTDSRHHLEKLDRKPRGCLVS